MTNREVVDVLLHKQQYAPVFDELVYRIRNRSVSFDDVEELEYHAATLRNVCNSVLTGRLLEEDEDE